MKRRSSLRFTLLTIAAGLTAGAIVFAQQAQVQRIQVPRVQPGSVETPIVGAKRTPAEAQDRLPTITMPVMSPEDVSAWVQAAREKLPYLPGRVLVRFRGAAVRDPARVLGAVQSDPRPDALEWIGDVAIVKDRSGEDPRQLAERFRRNPEVEFAEPDYIVKKHAVPNDPSYNKQWNFTLLAVPRAWDIVPGGSSNVIVAVVDTGVTAINPTNVSVKTWNGSAIIDHVAAVSPSPDFSISRFVQARDFTINPSNPGTVVIDTDDHGTHVAGTVGTDTNNGFSLAGIAYNVRIMPLKACVSLWDVQFAWSAAGFTGFVPDDSDGCSNSHTSAAIRYAADNGANVLNYSIGGTSPNPTVLNAMNYAIGKGTFIAMSNGNEGNDGNPTTYPAAYGPQLQGAMSVAASTVTDDRASYSTTGSFTEIAAPGGNSGGFIYQMTLRSADHSTPRLSFFTPRFDRYDERGFSGTSMASPHVAGLAALIASHGVTNPATIEGIIKSSAKDLGDPGRDNSFGFGRIQPFVALFGQGIVR